MMRACDNPFAVHRVLRQRYRLDDAGWTRLLARLASHEWRGAIVGPHGAGKTTLLEDLAARLSAAGWRTHYIFLNRESPRLAAGSLPFASADDFILLDGAEQLPALAWWRFRWQTRRAGGLVITTHSAGRLPTLWECRTSPELLRAITADLGVPLDSSTGSALHGRHAGNVREALRELYDRAACGEAFPPAETAQNSSVVVSL